jgi:serine/threonine protein kinase
VLDVVLDSEHAYLIRDYIEGNSLRNVVHSESPLEPIRAARIILQLAKAVGYIHRLRRYHRDLKPENVLLAKNDVAFLTDFGSAIDEDRLVTREGEVRTTFPYATPLALLGASRQIYRWSEVYSLGHILYELLAGERLTSDTSKEGSLVANIVTFTHPPELSDAIPWPLREIHHKCLRSATHGGYLTADDLANDLQVFVSNGNEAPEAVPNRSRFHTWKLAQSLADAFQHHGRHHNGLLSVGDSNWKEDLASLLPQFAGVSPNVALFRNVPRDRSRDWESSLGLVVGEELLTHSAFDEAVHWATQLHLQLNEISKERHDHYHALVRRARSAEASDIERLKLWSTEMSRLLESTMSAIAESLSPTLIPLFNLRFRMGYTAQAKPVPAEEACNLANSVSLPRDAIDRICSWCGTATTPDESEMHSVLTDRFVETILLYEGTMPPD